MATTTCTQTTIILTRDRSTQTANESDQARARVGQKKRRRQSKSSLVRKSASTSRAHKDGNQKPPPGLAAPQLESYMTGHSLQQAQQQSQLQSYVSLQQVASANKSSEFYERAMADLGASFEGLYTADAERNSGLPSAAHADNQLIIQKQSPSDIKMQSHHASREKRDNSEAFMNGRPLCGASVGEKSKGIKGSSDSQLRGLDQKSTHAKSQPVTGATSERRIIYLTNRDELAARAKLLADAVPFRLPLSG